MDSPRSSRMKQAQLPFLVWKKASCSSTKTCKKNIQEENKENSCTQASQSRHQRETAQTLKTANSKIVDLTEDDSRSSSDVAMVGDIQKQQLPFSSIQTIERVIDTVVKRAAEGSLCETVSTTKRRRTLSPQTTLDKMTVLCEQNRSSKVASKVLKSSNTSQKTCYTAPRVVLPLEMQKFCQTPLDDHQASKLKKTDDFAQSDALLKSCAMPRVVVTPLESQKESFQSFFQKSIDDNLVKIGRETDQARSGKSTASNPIVSMIVDGEDENISSQLPVLSGVSQKPCAVPKIIVTPSTPPNSEESLLSFSQKLFDSNFVRKGKEPQEVNSCKSTECNPIVNMAKNKRQRSKSHGDEAEQLDNEDQKVKTAEKSCKYLPLASILGKKRPRSKSPISLKSEAKKIAANPEESAAVTNKLKEMLETKEREHDATQQTMTSFVKASTDVITVVDDDEEIEYAEHEEEKGNSKECKSPPLQEKKSMPSSGTSSKLVQEASEREKTSKSAMKSLRSLEAMKLKKAEKEKEKEQKRKLREEQQLAREREKQEVMRRKEEEKSRKEEERRKKKVEEEAAKAEKQRKLEEKKREKEKLEQEKKLERERKEEERRKEKERKEEEKKQKELEKQKIEREKQEAEEQKRRRSKKHADLFKSFFRSPTRSPLQDQNVVNNIGIFAPFQLKQDMMLAPARRAKIDSDQKKRLDETMEAQDFLSLYLKEISSKPRKVSLPTMRKVNRKLVSLAEDGLELVESDCGELGVKVLRAKFLSFHTNYRPPYYGTWRKESKALSYKNPFKKDGDLFDYEFDSDDEWEEPAEGEDIANSDGEDEGDANEEDEDDGFFVPHGYLSDDEGINEEGEEDGMKPDHKLKQKQLEFEASFKRKLSHLTPIIIGCVWKDSAESLDKVHREMLNNYKPELLRPTPIEIHPLSSTPEQLPESPGDGTKSDQTKSRSTKRKAVPEEAMPDLIRLLHGNGLSLSRLTAEFRTYWKVKKGSLEPTKYGPMSLEEPIITAMDEEGTDIAMDEVTAACCPLKPESAVVSDSQSLSEVVPLEGIATTPKSTDNAHEISKVQMMKKCKEIAVYFKKENMNRSCWFVNDSVLEAYGMAGGIAPVPCKWKYITEVPKIHILMFPQTVKKADSVATALPPTETATTPRQSPAGANIAKFAAKLSPKVILEQCKLKHEKEKQAGAAIPSISRFATEKMSPVAIIEESAQKIAQDLLKAKSAKALEVARKNPPTPSQPQEGNFVIPTSEAMKSLFRKDPKLVVNLTDDAPKDKSD